MRRVGWRMHDGHRHIDGVLLTAAQPSDANRSLLATALAGKPWCAAVGLHAYPQRLAIRSCAPACMSRPRRCTTPSTTAPRCTTQTTWRMSFDTAGVHLPTDASLRVAGPSRGARERGRCSAVRPRWRRDRLPASCRCRCAGDRRRECGIRCGGRTGRLADPSQPLPRHHLRHRAHARPRRAELRRACGQRHDAGYLHGLRRADALAAALLASTPGAIVQAATRPEQQRRLTALGDLGTTAAALPPGLPTLLLVGDALSEAAAACDDRDGPMAVQAVGWGQHTTDDAAAGQGHSGSRFPCGMVRAHPEDSLPSLWASRIRAWTACMRNGYGLVSTSARGTGLHTTRKVFRRVYRRGALKAHQCASRSVRSYVCVHCLFRPVAAPLSELPVANWPSDLRYRQHAPCEARRTPSPRRWPHAGDLVGQTLTADSSPCVAIRLREIGTRLQ